MVDEQELWEHLKRGIDRNDESIRALQKELRNSENVILAFKGVIIGLEERLNSLEVKNENMSKTIKGLMERK